MSGDVDEAAMDRASEDDRTWFEQHPSRQHRVRPFVPGELPISAIAGDGIWIIAVRSVRPGVRARLPLYVRFMPPEDEYAALVVFELALEEAAG